MCPQVKLLYESEAEVSRQDVLRVADAMPELQHGAVTVRVRIEDVSKNHQNQRFRIAVLADSITSPADGDIAPATSNPVLVRSKRNKRNRKFAHLRTPAPQPAASAGRARGAEATLAVRSKLPNTRFLPPGRRKSSQLTPLASRHRRPPRRRRPRRSCAAGAGARCSFCGPSKRRRLGACAG